MIKHNFKKKFGQNFISDKNLLEAIVRDAEVNENDDVLEIGAGAGTLTKEISKTAKNVVSYEIDNDLKGHLEGLDLKNTKFVFGDVMNYNLDEIENDFAGSYKIIANLPYYITTPIIFKFLNGSKKLESLTIMVQKEVAERIVANPGGKDYGVLSVMIDFFGEASITRIVGRNMFYPQPNVDSAVVTIKLQKDKYDGIDKDKFYKFVQSCFSMRRKTLRNNLSKSGLVSREQLLEISDEILSKRAETFTTDGLVQIYLDVFENF